MLEALILKPAALESPPEKMYLRSEIEKLGN